MVKDKQNDKIEERMISRFLEIAIGTSVAVIFWFIVAAIIGYFIDRRNRRR